MKADYHVHTAFSDDSDYPMDQVVIDAISLGLNELCFTDHVDYGIKNDWDAPGGKVITIGSDSHKPEHLGAYITETMQELAQLGYSDICTFDRMMPVYHPLPSVGK